MRKIKKHSGVEIFSRSTRSWTLGSESLDVDIISSIEIVDTRMADAKSSMSMVDDLKSSLKSVDDFIKSSPTPTTAVSFSQTESERHVINRSLDLLNILHRISSLRGFFIGSGPGFEPMNPRS